VFVVDEHRRTGRWWRSAGSPPPAPGARMRGAGAAHHPRRRPSTGSATPIPRDHCARRL